MENYSFQTTQIRNKQLFIRERPRANHQACLANSASGSLDDSDWNGPQEVSSLNPGQSKVSYEVTLCCSELYPAESWKSPRIESVQPLWAELLPQILALQCSWTGRYRFTASELQTSHSWRVLTDLSLLGFLILSTLINTRRPNSFGGVHSNPPPLFKNTLAI